MHLGMKRLWKNVRINSVLVKGRLMNSLKKGRNCRLQLINFENN